MKLSGLVIVIVFVMLLKCPVLSQNLEIVFKIFRSQSQTTGMKFGFSRSRPKLLKSWLDFPVPVSFFRNAILLFPFPYQIEKSGSCSCLDIT